jgi:hypothetical protein
VNTATNFKVPKKEENVLLAERLSASQEGLCSMELVELAKEPC